MTKYRIDPEKQSAPSPEASAKYKDFNRLKSDYKSALERIHKKPLYRDPKMLFALALILLVVWLLLMELGEERPEEGQAPPVVEERE